MRGLLFAGALALATTAAWAEDVPTLPTPASAPAEKTITVTLSQEEAASLLRMADVTIKASGYAPLTVQALRIGEKVERAVQSSQAGK